MTTLREKVEGLDLYNIKDGDGRVSLSAVLALIPEGAVLVTEEEWEDLNRAYLALVIILARLRDDG